MQILCIGDSNTWGYNPENGMRHKRRWTKVLAELMPDDTIIEEGMCGRTFLSVDPYIPQRCGVDALPGIIEQNQSVDLVVVMNGTNELKSDFAANEEYLAEGIKTFIKLLKSPSSWSGGNVPELLMISPILLRDEVLQRSGMCEAFDENSLELSKDMADVFANVCEKYGIVWMDAAKYAKASLIDAIHMDEENHEKLAKAIYEKIGGIKL